MNLLIILTIGIAVFVLVRLMNIVQLTSQLAGENEEEEMNQANKVNGILLMVFMVVGLVLVVYMTLRYSEFMLPTPASEHGEETDRLLWWNFGVIGLVFFITQIALFYFGYKYRYRKERRASFYHEDDKLEIWWTVIPTIVLAALIVTGLHSWNKITQSDHDDGMKIQVYGYQFSFITRYAGRDNKLGRANFRLISDTNPLGVDFSDPAAADDIMTKGNEMHLPVGIPIDMDCNSRDVIHSVYMPHLRTQMNAVPGMTTNFYFKPTITTAEMRKKVNNENFDYVLLCNKVCGVAHYTMNMKLVIDEPEAFREWLKGERPVIEANQQAAAEAKVDQSASL